MCDSTLGAFSIRPIEGDIYARIKRAGAVNNVHTSSVRPAHVIFEKSRNEYHGEEVEGSVLYVLWGPFHSLRPTPPWSS